MACTEHQCLCNGALYLTLLYLHGTKKLTSNRRPNEHLEVEAGLALGFAVLLVIFGL